MRGRHAESFGPTLAAGLELKFLVCINVLYVLVPVLVHVLLDGSGHDSAEIDGTVERHATSAPSKQPVPAPRQSTKSSTKPQFHLEFGDVSEISSQNIKGKIAKQPTKSVRKTQSPIKRNLESKIPVKERDETETTIDENVMPRCVTQTIKSDDITTTSRTNTVPFVTIRQIETTTTTSNSSTNPKELEKFLDLGAMMDIAKMESLPENDTLIRQEKIIEESKTQSREIFEYCNKSTDYLESVKMKTTKFPESETILSTVNQVTIKKPETDKIEKVVKKAVTNIDDYHQDTESILKNLEERITKAGTGETASWANRPFTKNSKLDVWETMSRRQEERSEQWETAQFSQDTSPGSGNGDVYTKNSSSRHEIHSDTDSDGSPQPRRRSPSKRRLGSSSGSDVALHEGAELSPLEDDQGTALSQLTF